MDNFNLPRRPGTGNLIPPGFDAKPAAPAPAEAPPAAAPAAAPPSRFTGPLDALPDANHSSRLANEAGQAAALPWEPQAETPKAAAPAAKPFGNALGAEASRTLPSAANPGPGADFGASRRTSFGLPDAMPGALRRTTTGNLSSLASLQVWHKDVADAIKTQVANPDTIAQIPGKGTCVAATVQKTLARQNPELYASLAGELAMLGSAVLPNGTKLQVSPMNLKWIEGQGLSGGQKVDALLQAALMELGAPGQGYMLSADCMASNPAKTPGLSFDQARRLIETLLKTPVLDPRELKSKWDEHHVSAGLERPEDPLKSTPSRELARKMLQGAEAGAFAVVRTRDNEGELLRDEQGRPLVEGLEDDPNSQTRRPPKRSHMVQIISLDEEAGTVTFIDALGGQRTLPSTTFARIMLMTSRSSELEGIGSPDGAAL